MHTMPSRLVRVTPPLLCECKQEHGACLGDITPSAVFFSPRARPSFVPPSLRYSALFTQHPTTFTLTPCSDRQKTGQGSLPTAHEKTESPPAAQVPHIGRSARRVSHRAALTRPSPSTTPRNKLPRPTYRSLYKLVSSTAKIMSLVGYCRGLKHCSPLQATTNLCQPNSARTCTWNSTGSSQSI
jgi:hypothetical protein